MKTNGIVRCAATLALGALVAVCGGCRRGAPGGRSATTQPGQPAHEAWKVAQGFCDAWKKGSWQAAKALASQRLIDRYGQDRVRAMVIGAGNAVHYSYELFEADVRSDRVEFRVRMDFILRGQFGDRQESHSGTLTVAQEEGTWRVIDFPIPDSDVPS